MAARRRSHKTRDLPPNLYVRNDGYYSFRDPRTGKEYGLGRDKRYAVNEAIAANMSLQTEVSISLADRINGREILLFSSLIEAFKTELTCRKLKEKTITDYVSKIKDISSHFSEIPVSMIDTKMISEYLDKKSLSGKKSMSNLLRSTLSDIYKTGIRKGLINSNPVDNTRAAKVEIIKERLLLDEYIAIRKAAESMASWVGLCFDLAVVTGQRIGDLSRMRWSDIENDKLGVIQGKTKTMIKISLSNKIEVLNLSLKDVLTRLKEINSQSELVLDGRTPQVLANAFRVAREKSGLKWTKTPPPFHELRSLSGRLYSKQKGKEFAQDILGHKSANMTEKYTDGRGKDWKEV